MQLAGPPAEQATLYWGLHLWGDAVDPAILPVDWAAPVQRVGIQNGWAVYRIPLQTDEAPVNFIMHRPSGDSVPDTREPGGDRSFLPIDSSNVWIIQGDPTVYTSQPIPDPTPAVTWPSGVGMRALGGAP